MKHVPNEELVFNLYVFILKLTVGKLDGKDIPMMKFGK